MFKLPVAFLIPPAIAMIFMPACGRQDAAEPPAPAEPIVLFNGNDLSGWEFHGREQRRFWTVGEAKLDPEAAQPVLLAEPGGSDLVSTNIVGADLYTSQNFRDFHLALEFMLPPKGNSGIYLLGQYEMQIEHDPDADPDNPSNMNMGSVPRMLAPRVLVPIEPGQWHTYEIEFRAPRFDEAGRKTANARLLRMAVDDIVVQENVEIPGPTLGAMAGGEVPQGPIFLQGSHTGVAFRNIVLTPR